MMKILMFNYEYPPLGGGGGVFNKQLAEELVKNNNFVTIITSRFNSKKPKEVLNGVKIIRVPTIMRADKNVASLVSMISYFPASLAAGYKHLCRERYDLIHTMFAIPSAPSALALSKHFKIPHLLSILGGDIFDPSKKMSPHKTPLLHSTVKLMIGKSEKVVALSYDIKSRAVKHYKAPEETDVIHLGIPEPEFPPARRADFGFSADEILLVTVGRLIARKGLYDLIEIIKGLGKDNLKLIIIGDGPKRRDLQKQADRLNLHNQVRFMGYVSDEMKFRLLSFSDIYVSSSSHEGFGIVFLEAMAAGLPIICYNKGGQSDYLKEGKTGYLVEYGEKELFRKHLKRLCEEKMLREKIGNFNKSYAKNFYIKTCAERYQEIYKSIVKNTIS
jgi:glycosyltransferase involved in cell wall biosynthesis